MERHLIEPDSPEPVEVKCKACKGSGKDPDYDIGEDGEKVPNFEKCGECQGEGIVCIDAEEYHQIQLEHYADLNRD